MIPPPGRGAGFPVSPSNEQNLLDPFMDETNPRMIRPLSWGRGPASPEEVLADSAPGERGSWLNMVG